MKDNRITFPAKATATAVASDLDSATLENISVAVSGAVALIDGAAKGTKATKTSVMRAVLRVVAGHTPAAVLPILKDVCTHGARVPTLSTIRAAVVKIAAAYADQAFVLPHWETRDGCGDAGEAAITALAARDDASAAAAALARAAALAGIPENGIGRILADLAARRQSLAEGDEGDETETAAAAADEAAAALTNAEEIDAAMVELAALRTLHAECIRVFGENSAAVLIDKLQEFEDGGLSGILDA